MKKKEIKEVLKGHGHKMINASWYLGNKEDKSALFNTFDNGGSCYRWYVNWKDEKVYANKTLMSTLDTYKPRDVSYMFENIVGG